MTNNFTSTVTQLIRGNDINIQQFWNQIQNKKNSNYYSLKLFDIVSLEKKRQKFLSVVERMTSMILILEYFHNMQKRDLKLIEEARTMVRKIEADVSLASRWIFEMFLESSKEQVFIQGFLRVLAEIPLPKWLSESEEQKERELEKEMKNKNKQLMLEKKEQNLVLKDYIRVKDIQEQNIVKLQPYYDRIKGVETSQKNKEFAFGYICFVDYMFVKDLKLSQGIYKQIIDALYQLLNLSSVTKVHTGIVMMLHFVQNIIRFYVLPYRQKIKQLLIVMRQFRNFPVPIGVLAQQIVEMLYDEIKVLGFTYRYNMRINLPSLDVMEADNIDYTAYFVSETEHLLNNNAFCSIDTLRKALVLNMISRVNKTADKKDMIKISKKIARMPLQTAYQYYSKLLKIGEICMSANTIEQTIKIQQKAINTLLNQISNIPDDEANQFDHVIKEMKQIYKNQDYNFFEFPQCEIKCISLAEFTDKDSKVQNFRAILENQSNTYKLHQQKFRVIFRGTDKNFRSIVQRIGERYQQKQGALSLRTLQLYILPEKKSQSMLAAYIAKYDCWYSQFIYNPCVAEHFYPECKQFKHQNLPGLLISKVLQSYIRQATRYLNIRLFKCCLQFHGNRKSENVFFCRSIQMGLSALVSKYRYLKKKYQDLDYMQILLQKVKDHDKLNQEMTIIMQMDVCDMFGEDIETVSFQEVKLSDLRVCNIPIQYFFGKQPNPSNDFLQISLLKSENAKQYEKLLRQKSLFKKSQEEVIFAFRSLFECESIKSMFVQSNGKGMTLCIDGEIFEDVISVRVDVNQKKLKENKLPIKTFLPFKLN